MTAPTEDLIERLEAAEAGSEALSAEICVLFQYGGLNSEGATDVRTDADWEGDLLFEQDGEDCCNSIPPVTTSLDAALALAERVLPGWVWLMSWQDGRAWAEAAEEWWSPHQGEDAEDVGGVRAIAKTPALAICIAILRAHSTLNTGSGEG